MVRKLLLAVVAAALGLSVPLVQAENYALLIAIKDYPQLGKDDEDDLPGTSTDLASYVTLSRQLGVKDEHIFVLKDEQANARNILSAFEQLTAMVSERDNVLVSYSGHGAQMFNPASQQANQCSEGIITLHQGKPILIDDQTLRQKFDALSEKAGKVVVFFDACFSGGALSTRAGGKLKDAAFQPRAKVYRGKDSPAAAANQCGNAVNRPVSVARGLTTGKRNMVFFAASAENEIAIDTGERYGGLATLSWMACLNDPATDVDRSGAVSAHELHACAQGVVKEVSVRHLGRKDVAQHLQLEGNTGVTVTFADTPPAALPSPVSPSPAPAATPASPAAVTGAAIATLTDIYNSRNEQWAVTLQSDKPAYKIRSDAVALSLNSGRAGFAYIFMVGTGPDSQGMTLVFPNDRDAENAIAAGQTLALPRTDKWRLLPGGPAGTDHLLAVVASRPIDFSKAGTSKAAIFQQSGTTTRALAGIQRALTRTLVVDAPEAPDASYGAALLKINEYD